MWEEAMKNLTFIYSTATAVLFPQLQDSFEKYGRKLITFAYPYSEITFDEFTGEHMKRSEAYTAILHYLSDKSTASARRLKADVVKDGHPPVLSVDYNEEIVDEHGGIRVWWSSNKTSPRASMQFSIYPAKDEKKYFKLVFHNIHKKFITDSYLSHVVKRGKEIERDNSPRKLYSNNPSQSWNRYNYSKWSHVVFEHPAKFETLAMDKEKKEEIKNDLDEFINGRDYYARIGKAWKRGYLLYGPPGTGKTTMIAAMAKHLDYDVYDLELTAVKDNTELKRLLIDTTNKSILVIEDIDCSLDLTCQRDKKKQKENDDKGIDPAITNKLKEEETKDGKVTLSGLLNCIDGLWSSCGSERIIVFTTNYVEKLDPALIRRGRMDKPIKMSYCCFDAFKVLAKNHLEIDSHPLFGEIEELLKETKITPADIVENLMPKSKNESKETRLNRLIEAIKAAKEEEGKKVEEEASSPKDQKRKRSQQSIEEEEEKNNLLKMPKKMENIKLINQVIQRE